MLRTTGRQNYSCAINRDSGVPRCENRLSAYYAVRAQMGYAENCIGNLRCESKTGVGIPPVPSLSHSGIHSKTQ